MKSILIFNRDVIDSNINLHFKTELKPTNILHRVLMKKHLAHDTKDNAISSIFR